VGGAKGAAAQGPEIVGALYITEIQSYIIYLYQSILNNYL